MRNNYLEHCSTDCKDQKRQPVCGSDQKTYPSLCLLNWMKCASQGRVEFSHNGPCQRSACFNRCLDIAEKLCGTDGNTYLNLCYFLTASCKKQGSIGIAYKGACEINQADYRRYENFRRFLS